MRLETTQPRKTTTKMKYILFAFVGIAIVLLLLLLIPQGKPLPVVEKAKSMHGQAFVNKTNAIAKRLGIPGGGDTLISIMWGESGLKPHATNSIAGGLIGFLHSNIRNYGLEPSTFLRLSAMQQLDYVEHFYKKWKDRNILQKAKRPEDVYLLTFYPYAVGKPNSYEFGSHNGTAANVYRHNSGLDYNRDGRLTVQDFRNYLRNKSRLKGTIFNP